MRIRAWIAITTASILGAVVSSWPMMRRPWSHLPGLPGAEVVDHLWGLWVGLQSGPVVVQQVWIDAPRGFDWVLVDPLDLLWFAPAAVMGPVLAFCAVQLGNLVVAGLAGAALWRWVLDGSDRGAVFAAFVGPLLPVLAGGLITGMTEAQTFGWIGLALAAQWQAAERGRAWIAGAGLLLGGCVWAGPYTGLYGAIAATGMAVAQLVGHPDRRRVAGRLALLAGLAGLVAAPVLQAILVDRAAIATANPDLPGAASLASAVFSDPDLPENKMLSGDLLGLVWPTATHGIWGAEARGAIAAQHVSYLGLVLTGLAIVGGLVRRRVRALRVLLVPLGLMMVLGLGYHLQVHGHVLRVFDTPLLLPGGALSAKFSVFGQAARWYRAHIVAGVLVVPLAAAGVEWFAQRAKGYSPAVVLGLALLVLGDALGSGSLEWPRPVFEATPPSGLDSLSGDGPLFFLPAPRGGGSAQTLRNPALLWQTWHGRPINGNPLVGRTEGTHPEVVALDRKITASIRRGVSVPAEQACAEAAALGFEWLVHLPGDERLRLPLERAISVLGTPDVQTEAVWAWRLVPVADETAPLTPAP